MNPAFLISILALLLISGLLIVLGRRGRNTKTMRWGIGLGVIGCVAGVGAAVWMSAPTLYLRRLSSNQLLSMPDFPQSTSGWSRGELARGNSPLARELLRRVKDDDPALLNNKASVLVSRVIQEQLRDDVPWDAAWGDIITTLHTKRVIDDAVLAQSALAGTRLSLETRQRAAKGAPLPLRVKPTSSRLGRKFGYRGSMQVVSARLGGKEIDLDGFEKQDLSRPTMGLFGGIWSRPRTIHVKHNPTRVVWDDVSWPWVVHMLDLDLPTGTHDLDVVFKVRSGEGYLDDEEIPLWVNSGREIALKGRIEVVDDRDKVLPKQSLSAAQREALKRQLAQTTVQTQKFAVAPMPRGMKDDSNAQDLVQIRINAPDRMTEFDTLFRIDLLVGDRRVAIGHHGSIRVVREVFWGPFIDYTDDVSRTLFASPLEGVDKVTLVFTPDVDAALREVGIEQIVSEEFRIQNVPIQRLTPGSLRVKHDDGGRLDVRILDGRSSRGHSGLSVSFDKLFDWTLLPPSPFGTVPQNTINTPWP
jgi:hypothetical protein